MRLTRVLSLCAAMTVGSSAMAFGPAVTGFTGGTPFGGYYTGTIGDVIGFRFTADVSALVTSLGVLNSGAAGLGSDLTSNHMVGLWRNSDKVLLASVEVTPGSSLIGDFRYESISAVTIDAGTRYTLGAMYLITDGDTYYSSPATISLDGISATNGVFPTSVDLGFVYPEEDSTNLARLGPNMITAPVPEPATMFVLASGVLALARKRRK